MRTWMLTLALATSTVGLANPTDAVGPSPVAQASAPLTLNSASISQLAALDGVDEPLAAEIVKWRGTRGGRLSNVEQLRAVPGITNAALESIRKNVGIELSINKTPKTYSSVEAVLGEFAHEPSVQDVQYWADEYARTSPEMIRSWNRAARGFAALPRLQVEYYVKNDWDRDFDYVQQGDDLVTDPQGIKEAQDDRVLIRGQWDLSELVMSSDRIRIINESQDAVKLRDKTLSQVTRLYFDRRRHQVEMLLNPRSSLNGKVEDELRLLELTASIDALTGGQFSRSIPASRP